jgi:hypothetical protein
MSDHFYTALTAYAAIGAVIAALVAVWLQNRAVKKLASMQMFLQLVQQYDSDEMRDRRKLLSEFLQRNPTPTEFDDSVLCFLETLAHMTRRKLLDQELVLTHFSIDICVYWSATENFIRELRERCGDKTLYEELEWLNSKFGGCKFFRSGLSGHSLNVNEAVRDHFLKTESTRLS